MLFTRDTRAVLVSSSVERFCSGLVRESLGGKLTTSSRSPSPLLLVLEGFRRGRGVVERETEFAGGAGSRFHGLIQEKSTADRAYRSCGTANRRRRIEDEIEMSRAALRQQSCNPWRP